jgi:hypothetical protein
MKTKIRAKINEKIHKIMSWVLLNINNIEKTLNRLIKKEKTQIKSEMKEETLQLIPQKCTGSVIV